jgi:methionyl-tRNA formyltransferase
MNADDPASGLRLLFFGLPAGVSARVLSALLADDRHVVAVVLPAESVPHLTPDATQPIVTLAPPIANGLPLAGGAAADTPGLAWAAGLPLLAARELAHADTLAALAAFEADVACVACFTRRIPATVLSLPRLGFLNVHPSLLPAYRGPEPVFWMLRAGESATGATVHYMNDGLDTGDIAAQITVPLPDGISESAAQELLMRAGSDVLRRVLDDLARGVVRRQPQHAGGSAFGFPSPADFDLSTTWPARRAFNFMRGTAERGQPYPVEVAGRTEWLAEADDYAADVELDRPSVRHGRSILIRFNPGILYARTVR